MVDLAHVLGLKLTTEKIERWLRLGTQKNATRVGVEAVDVRDRATHRGMDLPHEVLPRLVPAVRSDQ